MSYYFCIVGTRDNPLYQADLASKPAGSSGASSFFGGGGAGTSSASSASPSTYLAGSGEGGSNGASSSLQGAASASGGGGGVFGFGNALGAFAGGLGGSSGITTSSARPANVSHEQPTGDGKGLGFGRYNEKHVLQMIAHSSLDVVEDKQFSNNLMYLKSVDRINEWTTSAFIAPGNIKFLILHEHKHDDGIRNFFYDVWEMLVKVMMNPFHDLNEPIRSSSFDAKVRASARKHL